MTTKGISFLLSTLLLAAATFVSPAIAADKIHAGKTIGVLWVLTPIDVGVAEGFFAKRGLDVEITTLAGDSRLMQGFVSGDFDIGLSGSTGMIFAAKGAPIRGIAALDGEPRDFSLLVAPNSSITSVKDLKGKSLGTAVTASFPEWLGKRVSVGEGWGPDGIKTTVTGGFEATIAAMRTGQLEGFIGATELGYQLAEKQQIRIIVGMEQFVPRFHTHVVLGREAFVRDHPDVATLFLQGLFEAIAFMKANRDKTIELTAPIMHMSPAVIAKTYDYEIAMLSDDGVFDPASLKVLKDSYVEMGLLPEAPTDDQLLTRQFVPVKFR